VYVPILIILAFASLSLVATSNAEYMSCMDCVQIPSYEVDHYKAMFPITVWTDSTVYDHHSIIKVTGHLKPQNTVSPILVVVTNPTGNVVTIQQFASEGEGDFSFELNTQSPLWTQNGDYVLKVQSGVDTRQFKTKFTLVPSLSGAVNNCKSDEISTQANNGRIYCIPFKITSGTVTSTKGTLNSDTNTFSFELKGYDISSVILQIPRYVLDSKSSDGDSVFSVMSNGKMIQPKELESDSISRNIQLDFLTTNKVTIDIIGTHAIPEFGSIALLILIGSIMSILVISKSFSNRLVKF
jgi:predicted secreted protein with PEFG-CTERM motif